MFPQVSTKPAESFSPRIDQQKPESPDALTAQLWQVHEGPPKLVIQPRQGHHITRNEQVTNRKARETLASPALTKGTATQKNTAQRQRYSFDTHMIHLPRKKTEAVYHNNLKYLLTCDSITKNKTEQLLTFIDRTDEALKQQQLLEQTRDPQVWQSMVQCNRTLLNEPLYCLYKELNTQTDTARSSWSGTDSGAAPTPLQTTRTLCQQHPGITLGELLQAIGDGTGHDKPVQTLLALVQKGMPNDELDTDDLPEDYAPRETPTADNREPAPCEPAGNWKTQLFVNLVGGALLVCGKVCSTIVSAPGRALTTSNVLKAAPVLYGASMPGVSAQTILSRPENITIKEGEKADFTLTLNDGGDPGVKDKALPLIKIPGDKYPICDSLKKQYRVWDIVTLRCITEDISPPPNLKFERRKANPVVKTGDGQRWIELKFRAVPNLDGQSYPCQQWGDHLPTKSCQTTLKVEKTLLNVTLSRDKADNDMTNDQPLLKYRCTGNYSQDATFNWQATESSDAVTPNKFWPTLNNHPAMVSGWNGARLVLQPVRQLNDLELSCTITDRDNIHGTDSITLPRFSDVFVEEAPSRLP